MLGEVSTHCVNWCRAGGSDEARALRLALLISGLDQWGLAYTQAFGLSAIHPLTALIGGLQVDLIAKTLGSQAHIVVRPPEEAARAQARAQPGELLFAHSEKPSQHVQSLQQWQPIAEEIARTPGVLATTPEVLGAAFVLRGAVTQAVAVRGIEPDSFNRIIPIARKLNARQTLDELRKIVQGSAAAVRPACSVGVVQRSSSSTGGSAAPSSPRPA